MFGDIGDPASKFGGDAKDYARGKKAVKAPKGYDSLDAYLGDHGDQLIIGKYTPWVLQQLGYDPGMKPTTVAEHAPALWARIQERFPAYNWASCVDDMVLCRPSVGCGKQYLSFASIVLMALGRQDLDVDPLPPGIMRRLQPVMGCGIPGMALARFMRNVDAHFPKVKDQRQARALANWVESASAGESTTLLTVVCPDYPHENGKYVFGGLWEGVGLVAQRALDSAAYVAELARSLAAPVSWVIAMADFEGDHAFNRDAAGVGQEEFIRRCRASCDAILAALPELEGVNVSVMLFSELMPEDGRFKLRGSLQTLMDMGAWIAPAPIGKIWKERKPFMLRWFQGDEEAAREAFLAQVMDYAAVGVAARGLPNCLVLGVESPLMAGFMDGGTIVPRVYRVAADY